jgi:inositol oxygenase
MNFECAVIVNTLDLYKIKKRGLFVFLGMISNEDKIERETFRNYDKAEDSVKDFYKEQHTKQTLEFNRKARNLFAPGNMGRKLTMWDALCLLDSVVDESDPDTTNSQLNHGFQTAEALRRIGEPRWLQLVGLIHDSGKHENNI